MNISLLTGQWKSIKEIPVLNYHSNFSNWIDASATPGHYLFEVHFTKNTDTPKAKLKIPVLGSFGKGYYTFYDGRLSVEGEELNIWQNEEIPVIVDFSFNQKVLSLTLFDNTVNFQKIRI